MVRPVPPVTHGAVRARVLSAQLGCVERAGLSHVQPLERPVLVTTVVSRRMLTPELVEIACIALPIGILLPAATVYQSLQTGYLVNAHKTRAVPESVALFLVVTATGLFINVELGELPGVQATLISVTAGVMAQNFWLWRSQRKLRSEDQESAETPSERQ